MVICKRRKDTSGESKPANTLTLEFQPPAVWEISLSCSWSVVLGFGNLSRLTRDLTGSLWVCFQVGSCGGWQDSGLRRLLSIGPQFLETAIHCHLNCSSGQCAQDMATSFIRAGKPERKERGRRGGVRKLYSFLSPSISCAVLFVTSESLRPSHHSREGINVRCLWVTPLRCFVIAA